MSITFKHNDCLNFAPVDVAKGICLISNETVFIDSDLCHTFAEAPKCKNCCAFSQPDKDNIGVCKGLKKEAWTHGDIAGGTCEGYIKR